ncbi:MAG: hypothetical protein ABIM64_04920 [candidate division WOR-3 bacterium]
MIGIRGFVNFYGKTILSILDADSAYPLTDGFDVFNIKGDNNVFFNTGLFRKPESSFFFSYDGLKLYSVVTSGATQQNHFREYNLSSPFNLNTITFSNKYTVTGATSSSSRSI